MHIGCRSIDVPAPDPAFSDLEKGATRIAKGEHGSEVVPADMTYYEWLKTQSPAFQDAVIGPRRGELLRDGGLTAERFRELQLNNVHQPRTLKEITRLEPLAFEKVESAKINLRDGGESSILYNGVTDTVEDRPVIAFEPLSPEGIERLQKQSDEAWAMASEAERKGLESYTRLGYHDINRALRDGTWKDDQTVRNEVESIDGAMAKFGLQDNMVVYRGEETQGHYKDWNVGEVRTLDSYVSTAVKKEKAYFTEADIPIDSKGVVHPDYVDALAMEIYVPKGARGFYAGTNSKIDHETELLLGRGQKYRLLERRSNFMRLEVVP